MLSNLEGHALLATFIIGSLGLCYFLDRSYNSSEPELPTYEFPPTQDIPASDDSVSTVSEKQSCIEPAEQPTSDALTIEQTAAPSGYKDYTTDYRNQFWPSPRPVNFVRAIARDDYVKIDGRLTHGKAIEFLSLRVQMTPEQFLEMDPITYTKLYMPSRYTAAILLGQSIQRLEDTIRRHQYLADLRRNG